MVEHLLSKIMINEIIVAFNILENQAETYSLVMEYADNGTLRSYLKKNFKNLTWDNKFNFARQLTGAILCLHDEGVVHRDLVINFVMNVIFCSI